jgi:hypothetical protein
VNLLSVLEYTSSPVKEVKASAWGLLELLASRLFAPDARGNAEEPSTTAKRLFAFLTRQVGCMHNRVIQPFVYRTESISPLYTAPSQSALCIPHQVAFR